MIQLYLYKRMMKAQLEYVPFNRVELSTVRLFIGSATLADKDGSTFRQIFPDAVEITF